MRNSYEVSARDSQHEWIQHQQHHRGEGPAWHLSARNLEKAIRKKLRDQIVIARRSIILCCSSVSAALHSSSNDDCDDPASLEMQLRQEATMALLPVFFPRIAINATAREHDILYGVPKPIPAETSLKRLLRKKYQRSMIKKDDDRHKPNRNQQQTVSSLSSTSSSMSNSVMSNDAKRSRVAALILGTSIMRLRHWYVVATQYNILQSASRIPTPYPLDPSILSFLPTNTADGNGVGTQTTTNRSIIGDTLNAFMRNEQINYSIEEVLLVRAMVEEHARYLSKSRRPLPILPSDMNTPANYLSLRYSLPTFFTSSLLSHYGQAQTEQMCLLMNNPGPVTIRKNSIRFHGTDEELCQWLQDEDGVRAKPLSYFKGDKQQHEEEEKNDCSKWQYLGQMECKLVMTATYDGSNRYIMGDVTEAGRIVPPEGCIQIIPPQTSISAIATEELAENHLCVHSDNGTKKQRSIETHQKKLSKSIWSMKGWKNGYFEVQDAGSQVIVHSLEVAPGDSILDYCAGNGGKTLGLASILMSSLYVKERRVSPTHCSGIESESVSTLNTTKGILTNLRKSHILAHDVRKER